jgi:phosphatidylglycerol:prolipoprotein diacylglycerol transferase
MYPTLATFGQLTIHTYTAVLIIGLLSALALAYSEGRSRLGNGQIAMDLGLWSTLGGIVGGRTAYVVANWTYYEEVWSQVFAIWEGGFSFHGAFLGGLLAAFLFAEYYRLQPTSPSFWQLVDIVTPSLGVVIVFGWIACLMAGCAYGMLGEGPGYPILPDIYGIEAPRFATQVVAIAFAVLLFIPTWLLRNRWPFDGASFLVYTSLYFTGQFFIQFTRGDESIFFGPWRLAQFFDLLFALVTAALLLISYRTVQHRQSATRSETISAGIGTDPELDQPDTQEEHVKASRG